jgi:hypothetical protein
MLSHPGPIESEIQGHRIARETKFRVDITKRSAAVRLCGDIVEITSIKAAIRVDELRSESIHIDTGPRLGLEIAHVVKRPCRRASDFKRGFLRWVFSRIRYCLRCFLTQLLQIVAVRAALQR